MGWVSRLSRMLITPRNGIRRAPAFVVACPRSGTTWLRCAMNAHPEVICVERRLFGMHWDCVHDEGASRPRLRITADQFVDSLAPVVHGGDLPINVDELAMLMLSRIIAALDECLLEVVPKRVLVDKLTPYAGTAEVVAAGIRRCCPDAPIIQLVRDGRDVATSGIFHWLNKGTDGNSDSGIEQRNDFILHRRPGSRLERFFSDQEVSWWCDMWTTSLKVVELLRPTHRIITIRYDDMIRDLPGVLAGLFVFLEIDASRETIDQTVRIASFETMSGGRHRGQEEPKAHIRKGVTGDWRNYFTRADGEAFERLAGRELREWAYELNPAWPTGLPGCLEVPCSRDGEFVEAVGRADQSHGVTS